MLDACMEMGATDTYRNALNSAAVSLNILVHARFAISGAPITSCSVSPMITVLELRQCIDTAFEDVKTSQLIWESALLKDACTLKESGIIHGTVLGVVRSHPFAGTFKAALPRIRRCDCFYEDAILDVKASGLMTLTVLEENTSNLIVIYTGRCTLNRSDIVQLVFHISHEEHHASELNEPYFHECPVIRAVDRVMTFDVYEQEGGNAALQFNFDLSTCRHSEVWMSWQHARLVGSIQR